MITSNSDSCKQAEMYYYDYFCGKDAEIVPEQILAHIDKCPHCQAEVERLKSKLADTVGQIDNKTKQTNSAIVAKLERHFSYIDKRITCDAVKSFLPCLSEPNPDIRIPTPITAHLDNCRQCRDDLKTIHDLGFTSKQLHRLSQLFANESVEDSVDCSTARLAAPSAAAMDWTNVAAGTLGHLHKCRDCRELVYEQRQKIYDSLSEYTGDTPFSCETISLSDIFDCCFPQEIGSIHAEYAKFRESLISHLRICPTCLAKVQKVHKTVCSIAERSKSDVVTICTMDKSAEAKAISESDDLYAGFPIKVEVVNREDEIKTKPSIPTTPTTPKREFSTTKLRPLIKTVAAAAAVILIVSVFFLNTSTAGAVTIEQIYKAIDKIKNVYITKFIPDKTEPLQESAYITKFIPDKTKPLQERWVSKTFNVYLTKTADEYVLWDIGNNVKKSRSADTTAVEITQLSEGSLSDVEKRMSGSLGLTPFYNISEIPPDAEWIQIVDENSEAAVKNIKIYDLIWSTRRYNDPIMFNKWRFFVDIKTNLPQRTEFYQKFLADDEYTLVSVSIIRYLNDSEMQIVLEEVSF